MGRMLMGPQGARPFADRFPARARATFPSFRPPSVRPPSVPPVRPSPVRPPPVRPSRPSVPRPSVRPSDVDGIDRHWLVHI